MGHEENGSLAHLLMDVLNIHARLSQAEQPVVSSPMHYPHRVVTNGTVARVSGTYSHIFKACELMKMI